MHQTLADRWSRISLRTKITGVTVLMLTLGLLVSGIGTAAMLRSYVESQLETKLESIASSKISEYLTRGDGGTASDGGAFDFNASDDVFVAIYDANSGTFLAHNWGTRDPGVFPLIPKQLTQADVYSQNAGGGYRVFSLPDANGDLTFRGVYAVMYADDQGNLAPILIAISSQDTERLLAAYLTIFLGFGIGVVLVGALLTRMLVTTTFTPLREVEATAAAIADGDFSQRLGGATPNTEVGRLNRSLNTMLNRIDRAFRDRARTIDQMRRFVGDASHELRTPLVSVRGYAELYRMGALQNPEDVAQAMDRIEKEAVRMGGLVEDLLALARLDEAKPLDLAEVDLVPLARDAALDAMAANPGRTVTVIAPEAIATGSTEVVSADVEVDLDSAATRSSGPMAFAGATLARLRGRRANDQADEDGAPARSSRRGGRTTTAARSGRGGSVRAAATVDADAVGDGRDLGSGPAAASAEVVPVRRAIVLAEENKVRQVITNLMGNAIRFTPVESPIEIRISVDDDAERALLEIVDHGEGIPPQIREKIFQRFWRADTSRTRETGGSGLGLAIVSSIVSAHNGHVDVVETPGGGATFRVSLPLAGSGAAPQRVSHS
ncbi:sensor histidine kinase [Agromyces kandeliae]|uniref:histidine kinase n=1 Tax=Agromyces kandeliae TaxID=2666141 RepID=A0A6L5R2I6_9MICO|nr:ATP-binding protein [Agromyces kandeliae]MRX44142.1 HAMP domain-containing protein [Agromyces kandeliae]